MLVFLIFAVLLIMAILSIIFLSVASEDKAYIIESQYENGYYRSSKYTLKSKFWLFWHNLSMSICPCIVGAIIGICAVAVVVTSIVAIVASARRNVKYEQMQYQYIVLTERLEEDNNNYHLFYEDICNYNNAILEDRYWADNLWVNWYHNGKIKDLPLIGE